MAKSNKSTAMLSNESRAMIKLSVASLIFIVMATQMVGCAATKPTQLVKPNDPNYAPVPASQLVPPQAQAGSLFLSGTGMQLYGDKKARTVGDIITIELDERTVSSKSSQTSTSKTSAANLANPNIAGGPIGIAGNEISAEIAGDRSFSGSGDADQSNRLQGAITVTVSEILPNGVLRVRGEKWMTLNQGDEYIRITGLLRPEDINLDNSVSSQKLADARISYAGTGTLADSNKSGWLTSFFNSGWFPF